MKLFSIIALDMLPLRFLFLFRLDAHKSNEERKTAKISTYFQTYIIFAGIPKRETI